MSTFRRECVTFGGQNGLRRLNISTLEVDTRGPPLFVEKGFLAQSRNYNGKYWRNRVDSVKFVSNRGRFVSNRGRFLSEVPIPSELVTIRVKSGQNVVIPGWPPGCAALR